MQWKRFLLTIWLIGLITLLAGCLESGEQPILISLSITPASKNLEVSQFSMFTAVGIDQNNNEISVTPTWTVSNGIGTASPEKDSSTTFTATKAGMGKITATVGTTKASANITVTQTLTTIEIDPATLTIFEKESMTITAVGRDRFGNQMEITPVWSMTGTVGTVTPTSGPVVSFAATKPGNGTLVARVGDISGQCTITVQEEPELATIEISPAELELFQTETGSFTATGRDQYGNIVKITPTWSISAEIGSLSTLTGEKTIFTAETAGVGLLRATAGSISDEAEITVKATPKLNSLTIAPTNVQLIVDEQREFAATGLDQYNNPYPVNPTWTVTNSLGSIVPGSNGTAVFTAAKAGSGQIAATVETLTVSTPVNVFPVVESITLTPATATLEVGNTIEFSVTIFDEAGNELAIKPVWTVTNQLGTLTQNEDGTVTFTATKVGEGALIASTGNVSGSADIVVNPAP